MEEKPRSIIKIKSLPTCTELIIQFENLQTLNILVEKTKIASAYGPFSRWNGKVSATTIDGRKLEGHTIFQEVHF